MQHVAIYARVSGKAQDLRSQLPDLERWAQVQDEPVRWYKDKFTGKTMERPGWMRLDADIATGRVSKLVVWRLDRLGRTAAGLTALFEDLQRRDVGFESMREKIDLSTPSGRLMAHILASVAVYENEVRSERIRAGQAAAKAAGKRWITTEDGGDRGLRQPVGVGPLLGQLPFQLVTQGHQLVHLGHDPLLLGQGREGDGELSKPCHT